MKLSSAEKITLFSSFGVAILTILFHIGYRAYFQPDLRYEIGSYYITGPNAVTYLKLTNFGNKNAEKVAFSSHFGFPILDVSSDNPTMGIEVVEGGKGKSSLTARLKNDLSPKDSVTIYIAIDRQNKPMDALQRDFLKKITYNNGVAKTGKPEWFRAVSIFTGVSVAYGIFLFLFVKWTRKRTDQFYQLIKELIQLASIEAQKGTSFENYSVIVDEKLKGVSFRIVGLRKVADSAYEVLSV